MKLFITEFTHDEKRYSGPTIVAETLQIAEDSAADLGVEVVGELDSLVSVLLESMWEADENKDLH